MNISIIGAGNMGGATARGLARAKDFKGKIAVSDPSSAGRDALRAECPAINTFADNAACVRGADVVVLAVKPWLAAEVLDGIRDALSPACILVSFAAGIPLRELAAHVAPGTTIIRVIPNIAINKGESMSFLAAENASETARATVRGLFALLGDTLDVEEKRLDACMALSSCGIAYVMRYVRAATEGGVELGIRPADAQKIMLQTMRGAIALLENGANPESEIDKVTTPGGYTIKGLNAMEAAGFTPSVIAGLKASC